jgi:acyl-CoA reductase-like NAD-dependent aldehyde dehydrogenase
LRTRSTTSRRSENCSDDRRALARRSRWPASRFPRSTSSAAVASGPRERFEVISPIDGEPIAEVAAGGPDEVEQAVAAARDAFPGWAALGPAGRAELLHRLADLIDANLERLAIVECTDMAMLLRSLRARVIKRGALNYRAYADLAVALRGARLALARHLEPRAADAIRARRPSSRPGTPRSCCRPGRRRRAGRRLHGGA